MLPRTVKSIRESSSLTYSIGLDALIVSHNTSSQTSTLRWIVISQRNTLPQKISLRNENFRKWLEMIVVGKYPLKKN